MPHVGIAHLARNARVNHLARPVVDVEPELFERGPDRRIERAVGILGDGDRELNGSEEQFTGGDGLTGPCAQLAQLAVIVESGTPAFHFTEPLERAGHGRVERPRETGILRLDDLDGHDRPHGGDRTDA